MNTEVSTPVHDNDRGGQATGAVKRLLQAEGVAVAALAAILYAQTGWGWGWFFGLLLLPDIAMVGYGVNPRVGAACYNVAHSYLTPIALFAVTFWVPSMVPISLIWAAHIGGDRALGYGLKYVTHFKHTHLGS